MIAKMIEIRDSATFIPALAVQLAPANAAEEYLLARQGYERSSQGKFVLLTWLARDQTHYDPSDWHSRTLSVAHKYVIENFAKLEPGAVVDVEWIMGLRKEPKLAERLEYPLPAANEKEKV